MSNKVPGSAVLTLIGAVWPLERDERIVRYRR